MHQNKRTSKPGANQDDFVWDGGGNGVLLGVSGQEATLHTGLKPWESDSVQLRTWWGGRYATTMRVCHARKVRVNPYVCTYHCCAVYEVRKLSMSRCLTKGTQAKIILIRRTRC